MKRRILDMAGETSGDVGIDERTGKKQRVAYEEFSSFLDVRHPPCPLPPFPRPPR